MSFDKIFDLTALERILIFIIKYKSWTSARVGKVDRNWTKSGARLFSRPVGPEPHTTRADDVPDGYDIFTAPT